MYWKLNQDFPADNARKLYSYIRNLRKDGHWPEKMESQEKKKLAVVAGKRMAEESDLADASMEDLCRKKFKPIAPKPVIRKDQHQAVLSAALPVKDSSQRKEHIVLPSPRLDPNSALVMRPGSSFPFMCGGPMIMPIPVPVVPGKDGSYVPLQVPVPIPVMVPVVVSLSQGTCTSPSASTAVAVASDSKCNSSCSEKESLDDSKKDKNSKKGTSSKQDKSSGSGNGSDIKGPKAKPCRYKYSMIKNESLFRDILRGVGGDFMASHGITLAVPSSNADCINSMSKGVVATLDHNQLNLNDNGVEVQDSSQTHADINKQKNCEDSNSSFTDGNKISDGSTEKSVDVTVPPVESSKSQSLLPRTTQESLVASSGEIFERNSQLPYLSYSASSEPTPTANTLSISSASSNVGPTASQSGQSVPPETNFDNYQNTSTVNGNPSTRPSGSETTVGSSPSHELLTTASCPVSVPGTSVHSFSYYNTSRQNSVPSNVTNPNNLVSTPSSSVVTSNNMQCPPTSSVLAGAPHNSHWNYAPVNRQNVARNEPQNRHMLRPFHNLAQRIAAVQSSEHDHPDESNFYGIDELSSFSAEMDHSAGSLLSSSDDSVSAVLGMTDVAGSMAGTLSDSPTRRAVTAIVTPLPRSIPLTTSPATSTPISSQASENVPNSTQSGSQRFDVPPGQLQRSSDQVNIGSNAKRSSQDHQFASAVTSSSQITHQWSSPSNGNVRRPPNSDLSTMQNRYSEPMTSNSQPNGLVNFAVPTVGQQRSVHMEGIQSRMCSTVSSSNPMSKECVTVTQSANQTTLAYSASSQSAASSQRQPASLPNNFTIPNVNTNRTQAPRPSHFNNSDRTNVSYAPSDRNRNAMQNSQQMPNSLLAGNAPSGYSSGLQSQAKRPSYPMGANSNKTSPSKTRVGNRQGESQHSQMHNAAQSSHLLNRSSGFNSGNLYNASRSQAPAPSRSVSTSTGMTVTTSAMGSSVSNVWQASWSRNIPATQPNPFSGGGSGHLPPVSVAHCSSGPDQTVGQARQDSTTVVASTSVQSVPLQSNLQTRPTMVETLPPAGNLTGNHAGMPDNRGSSSHQMPLSGPVQTPMFGGNNQRHPTAHAAASASYNAPSTDSGPRMPYPLVPPIMFGNSAPPRGLPIGGIHSVPLPGSFPPTSVSEQNVQPPQIMSSSPSTVHPTITPVMHDRHRMYLPSHFSTLHRPLYMPPSPAPSTDLPLLSPHSCSQIHVHDSVLYSPRYPSSIHSLSPGVNTNFHASPLHRRFSSSDHQENFARSSISHPAPHYDSTISPMPLQMSQLGQGSSGVTNPVSSHSAQLPPSITSLQHSSIVANREQNSIFEQNLKRLLERSARRHSMALASSHGYPRSMPCDHTYTPRPMSSLTSLPSFAPPHSTSSVSFSTPPMLVSTPSTQPQSVPRLPSQPLPSRHETTTTSNLGSTTATVTTVSTTLTPTTSSIVTSRAILGNTSDKYLPLELLSPDSTNAQPATPTSAPSTPSPQVDLVVKCGDTVLQCSRQVLRESGRTVLCCWHCDYHTAEPRKMKRHQKKENEPLKCQLCSFESSSRCSVNQHYKQEHMDKDDPFRSVNP